MPSGWDPKVYKERARQWRLAAEARPPGKEREACESLAEDYEKLAALILASETGKKDNDR